MRTQEILSHPQNLSREKLARKRGLCEEFLKVYTKVDPGSSDWRGSTLFELAMTRAELAQRYYGYSDTLGDRQKCNYNPLSL